MHAFDAVMTFQQEFVSIAALEHACMHAVWVGQNMAGLNLVVA
jgi:hypothetical protein